MAAIWLYRDKPTGRLEVRRLVRGGTPDIYQIERLNVPPVRHSASTPAFVVVVADQRVRSFVLRLVLINSHTAAWRAVRDP